MLIGCVKLQHIFPSRGKLIKAQYFGWPCNPAIECTILLIHEKQPKIIHAGPLSPTLSLEPLSGSPSNPYTNISRCIVATYFLWVSLSVCMQIVRSWEICHPLFSPLRAALLDFSVVYSFHRGCTFLLNKASSDSGELVEALKVWRK
jgi:hypothetical protein